MRKQDRKIQAGDFVRIQPGARGYEKGIFLVGAIEKEFELSRFAHAEEICDEVEKATLYRLNSQGTVKSINPSDWKWSIKYKGPESIGTRVKLCNLVRVPKTHVKKQKGGKRP